MTTDLKEKYDNYKIANPKTRIRDAATALGVSEAELVATNPQNLLLNPAMQEILEEIPSLGRVMALTRNEHAVHERKGIYNKPSFNGHMGLVVGADIDLRLFMSKWANVFAVSENDRQSIQFFDTLGNAVHKIYLTEESNQEAYQELVKKYKATNSDLVILQPQVSAESTEKSDEEIDQVAFQQEWLGLQDTHDFFGLLRKHGVTRTQALRLAPAGHATPLALNKVEDLLNIVSEKGLEIMVFIGNANCLQIHTGKAQRILRTGPWINILDPDFNMHLRDEALSSVWIVKKPTNLGAVHSIETYDVEGNLVAQFFGKRKPDVPEREDWRAALESLTS
ncbi:hemin-degrading factor [Sphingobacterium corticibacter]|uniref:Hemin-degrading factor n=1 Tax=Sphingobacterium corticibacter TaxID=2171749 RepID=A0A2T8HHE3_9SPHI|nr:ChuX/HutX family heme-like substrate-binding protein [Sphingobacterium corticibacter]PVH24851.1 hemin-degrading factor [Sphingobacterium corticibacter]